MVPAVFLARPSRFLALVRLGEEEIQVHVPNTGRLAFLRPGLPCLLRSAATPGRKTAYDLFSVEVDGVSVVVDSLAPNRAAARYLSSPDQVLAPGETFTLAPEVTLGDSRVDFLLTSPGRRWAVEVKGTTWCENGIGFFPDAVSVRAQKHIRNLMALAGEGFLPALLFVSARDDVRLIRPAETVDPAFARALREAGEAGVRILGVCCALKEEDLVPFRAVPVIL